MTTLGAQIISNKPDRMRNTILWLRNLGIFDEIVAVADIDNGTEVIESAKLADRYVTQVFRHQEEAIDTAISLSTTDWMVRIDDDERMGVNFRDRARILMQDNDVDVYWFPRAWLYKDNKHFLSDVPWYPDYQPRLFRRGHLKASAGVHVHPAAIGNSRIENYVNIFHYLLIDFTYEQRLEKCKDYAQMMGFSLDEFLKGYGMFYLPEKYGDNFTLLEITEEIC